MLRSNVVLDLSFRIGRPPSMRQSDITLSYPDQEQRYDGGLNDGQLDTDCDLDIFIQMQLLEKNIMAAQIMHRVYELTISRLEINILEQRVIELEKEVSLHLPWSLPFVSIGTS